MSRADFEEHRRLCLELQKASETLIALRNSILKSPVMSDMPHGYGVGDRTGTLGIELSELSAKTEALREQVKASQKKISKKLDSIQDPVLKTVMSLRYVCYKEQKGKWCIRVFNWKEIAEMCGNTEWNVRKMNQRFLGRI